MDLAATAIVWILPLTILILAISVFQRAFYYPPKIVTEEEIVEAFEEPIPIPNIKYIYISVRFDSPAFSRFSTLEFWIIGQNLSKRVFIIGIPFQTKPFGAIARALKIAR